MVLIKRKWSMLLSIESILVAPTSLAGMQIEIGARVM